MNVFFHIPDFRAFLGNIVPLLRPTETISLRTASGGDPIGRTGYPDKRDFPDHLVFAGWVHLERFLEEQGFLVSWRAKRRLDAVTGVAKAIVKRVMAPPNPDRPPLHITVSQRSYTRRSLTNQLKLRYSSGHLEQCGFSVALTA